MILPGALRRLILISILASFCRCSAALVTTGILSLAGLSYAANRSEVQLAGTWKIERTWSENDYLAKVNVAEGTTIAITSNGYLQIGRLGLDGVIGQGVCRRDCRTFVVNGASTTFDVVIAGKGDLIMTLISTKPASIIVATRAD